MGGKRGGDHIPQGGGPIFHYGIWTQVHFQWEVH